MYSNNNKIDEVKVSKEPSIHTRVLVREIMNSPAITAIGNETAKDLALKMIHYKVGSVIITESEKPIGIVTYSDITHKAVARDLKPSTIFAKEIMSSPLYTIDSDKDIRDAARLMRKSRVKRLGVTYKNRLVGIITMSDIISIIPEIMDITSEKALIVRGIADKKKGYLSGYCDSCNQWSDYLFESEGKFQCDECREESKTFE